ncbi:MAG: ThuA domain-containing protein, partial [Planctomycetota bacterium]
VDYVESGKPIVGLRTSTHAFDPKKYQTYARFGWRNKEWQGGFGRQVLGETWIAHHGGHGSQATGGILAKDAKEHPILRGISDRDVWDSTDVYTVRLPLLDGIQTLVHGQVLDGMKFDSPPAEAHMKDDGTKVDKNNPMMPVAWVREWKAPNDKKSRVFATTLGASDGFLHAGTRRLLVNACYWALGLEEKIDPKSSVDIVGKYAPTPFGFRKHKKGVKPSDLR